MTTAAALSTRTRTGAFAHAVRAESAKLRSLPAIWLLLAGTLVLTVILSVAFAVNARQNLGPVSVLDFGVVAIGWTQVGFFLLGVIATTSEYIGGQIRTTLVAMPGRITQRLAAVVALIPLALVTAIITVLASITSVLIVTGTPLHQIDPAVTTRVALGAAGYLTLMAILSSGLGFLIRKTVPAAAVLLVYLLIVSPLLQGQNLYWLPDMASYSLWYATAPAGTPAAPIAWLIVIGWTVAVLVPSIITYRRRDV